MSDAPPPVPVPDSTSEGFWSATVEQRLVIQRCDECGWYSYPPALVCRHCRTDPPRFAWGEVTGAGTVRTWTVMRDSFLPGFDDEIPYVVADVELAEQPGLRFIARVRDVDPGELEIGLPVEVRFGQIVDGTAVPYFVRATR